MATLNLDYMSQPCRAIALFCRLNHLQVKEREVVIFKNQHKTEEMLAINPIGKLPFLQDGDEVLVESATILRYLATSRQVPDHWYPADLRARAAVDAALDWYQGNIRPGAAKMFWHRVIAPQGPNAALLAAEALPVLQNSFRLMESYWLKDRPFAAGQTISIADLLWHCELYHLHMLRGSPKSETLEELLQPYPLVQSWMTRVQETIGPEFDPVNEVLRNTTARFVARKERRERQQQASATSKL